MQEDEQAQPPTIDALQQETVQMLGVLEALKDHPYREETNSKPSLDNPLSMLDWFATLFVAKDQEDVVAAAMTLAEDSMTFYLSNNKSKDQEEARDDFMLVCEHALASNNTDLATLYAPFIEFIIKYCCARIIKKISKTVLLRAGQHPSFGESLTAALDYWVTQHVVESFTAREQSVLELPFVGDSETVLRPLVDRLNAALESGICDTLQAGTMAEAQDALVALWAPLRRLLFSNFMTQPTLHGPEFVPFISMARRRLWHIFRYFHGIAIFVELWLPEMRRKAKPVPSVLWLPSMKDRGLLAKFHGTKISGLGNGSEEFFNSLIHIRYSDISLEEREKLIKDIVTARDTIHRAWSPSGKQKVKLHCEIQMATFIEQERLSIHQDAIGVSKLCCVACGIWLNVYKAITGTSIQWTGISGRAHRSWALPTLPAYQHVTESFIKCLRLNVDDALDRIVDPKYRAQDISHGTDTSQGPFVEPFTQNEAVQGPHSNDSEESLPGKLLEGFE